MKYWLFYFLKMLLGIPFRVFAKHVYLDGLENIPKNKAVLFSSNHPNSFLDGVIFEYFLKRPVYTIVRGDVFNQPLPNKILRSLRLIPIFRARDARAEVAREKNELTYRECFQLFKKNRAILIFSEGDSYPQKGVRRFKNGTCNMAIDLYQRGEGNLDLYVVPCGLNYTFFGFGRRRIQLSFQQAIRMKDFESKFESDPRKLSIELTKSLQESIEVLVVNNMNERADLVDRAQVMALNSVTEPMFFLQKNSRADSSVQICNNISSDLLQYEALLKQYKIGDRNVLGNGFNYPALFLSIFTAAVAIPAFLLNFINWYLAAYYTNKMVKNNVFRDSIYFGIGLVGTIILMIIICTLSLLLFNTLWAWICIIAAITGMITWFNAVEEFDVMLAELRFIGLSREKKNELRSLRNQLFPNVKLSAF